MSWFILNTTTSMIIGMIIGWHFLPQPKWVSDIIGWYHGTLEKPATTFVKEVDNSFLERFGLTMTDDTPEVK